MSAVCHSCGASGLEPFYEVRDVPVHSVLLMRSHEEAVSYPKGDLRLGFCKLNVAEELRELPTVDE